MKFLYCASGANQPAVKEFEVIADKEINEGQVVCVKDGVIDGTVKDGVVLGVCAETHTGKSDILNRRANGNRLRVNITPDAVYAAKAKKITAALGCSATAIKCSDSTFSASVKSGSLVLCEKASGSTNTDEIGAIRKISATAVSSGTVTFTVDEGAVACEGDVYEFYPELGDEMYLDAEGFGYAAVNALTDVKLKTVGADTKKSEVHFKLLDLLFA